MGRRDAPGRRGGHDHVPRTIEAGFGYLRYFLHAGFYEKKTALIAALFGDPVFANIAYARTSRLSPVYFWGAEWWYWMRQNGNPEYWEYMRDTVFHEAQ